MPSNLTGTSDAQTGPETGPETDPETPETDPKDRDEEEEKLEHMLYSPQTDGAETGEQFFLRVMQETETQVKWPSKLKIGAKSKKDPHVKVEGKKDNVLQAKKMILEVLETRVNKVTLKMDVAYTEHSHVIGKGGGNIKKVMEVTSCHIHFPDSNRHNASGEKSNQVSIAGPVDGVEEARKRIRDLQPLALTFDLPVSLVPQPLPDVSSPLVQQVVQSLGVSVSFRAVPQTQPGFYGSCCSVWGLQGNAANVKKATCILMELLLGSEVTSGAVSTQLDVTSQQHLFLLGQNGAHFLSVMHQTQTQIILPDLSAPQSPPTLLIQGNPDGVCLARQQLMDCLPVCLMFDMREDGEADPSKLAQMMQNLGVFISVKPKVKQTSKSVVVKGLERNISCLYEARRLLLGLDSCEITKETQVTSDPVTTGSGLTHYWLNMLLQQLRLSEQSTASAPPTEGVARLKGTDSRPLEKIPENEDLSGQSDGEDPKDTSPDFCDSVSTSSFNRVGFLSRRGSLPTPDINRIYGRGRRHSTGQALSYRLLNSAEEGGRRNSLRGDHADSSRSEPWASQMNKVCNGSESENWRERRGSSSSSSSPSSPPSTLTSASAFPAFTSSGSRGRSDKTSDTFSCSSSYFEGVSSSRRASTCSQRSPSPQVSDDLPELLSQLGLLKYIDVFEEQEIDYQTFLTLSDDDLKEVGVSTFGARRKMLLAISDLNRSKRRLSDASSVKSGYLEGGASGRLPRIMDLEAAAQKRTTTTNLALSLWPHRGDSIQKRMSPLKCANLEKEKCRGSHVGREILLNHWSRDVKVIRESERVSKRERQKHMLSYSQKERRERVREAEKDRDTEREREIKWKAQKRPRERDFRDSKKESER
ncbi:hypothetical protein WMY93_009664 [Mugilogobius chulae]|uniref:SAM domain-containing protein n=1 Tax=Mugilogobius chulae TaxID=88201 RepID=A0AAW0PN69_9GOBI